MRPVAVAQSGAKDVLRVAPSLLVALTVTELFYKLHSFTLEFFACAATFAVLYGLQTGLAGLLSKPAGRTGRH
ncbi:MAG: hypothetical protein KIT11_10870 [Fimbriimonadaceae bacterium]|nr:hypothetical protein [Fimbriimonadaceae bacterium]QYK55823.1 MAG: hypothetical protein KF733_12540 [Fimbriimonadaceae bacterium]